jgi:hypothetical protein
MGDESADAGPIIVCASSCGVWFGGCCLSTDTRQLTKAKQEKATLTVLEQAELLAKGRAR